MLLDSERWLELRRFRGLLESGALSLSEIARETGLDRKTVRKYLSSPGPATPPRRSPNGRSRARVIDEFAPLVDAMLRAEVLMKAAVIHERLVAEYGFTGNYQRVKLYVQEARPRVAEELGITPKELAGLHRRFEVVPGAQAQVDWADEGKILAHMGIGKVYSFHMTLSYSRDPFCCFTTSQDLETFFDCHRRAFAHFGGVPMTIVYDRTKTVVRRHVAPGEAVPLHPEAVGFAGHYDFDIDVLAAYRPTGKGRVERQVLIVRDHVLSGRAFSSIEEMDAAFTAWVPRRRDQIHQTHREVIGHRAARDHAALKTLPPAPYLVAERHLRPVGKDCLIAFGGNLYSVPARKVRPRQLVEVRATKSQIMLHATVPGPHGETLLAMHPRAVGRGVRVVEEQHWDGRNEKAHERDDNRDKTMCPKYSGKRADGWVSTKRFVKHSWTALHPEIAEGARETISCDEFPFSSTYQSPGVPTAIGGQNHEPIDGGGACIQTVAAKTDDGSEHLLDDTRYDAPSFDEKCGRSSMSGKVNSGSMSLDSFYTPFLKKFRIIDQDKYLLDPGNAWFKGCDPSKADLACTMARP